ncbi:MAG TPA: BofC C-terminal domain-containing protein [Bacillota bacterium]
MKIYRRHLPYIIGVSIGLVTVFAMGFFYSVSDFPLKRGGRVQKGDPIAQESERTRGQIQVRVIDYYLRCHHNTVKVLTIQEEDYHSFLSELTCDWEARGVADERTLTKRLNTLCDNCQHQEYLGIYQDYVAVYHGTPDCPGPVKEVTGIRVSGLPENEVLDLKTGVPCRETEEKLLILESYSELAVENRGR